MNIRHKYAFQNRWRVYLMHVAIGIPCFFGFSQFAPHLPRLTFWNVFGPMNPAVLEDNVRGIIIDRIDRLKTNVSNFQSLIFQDNAVTLQRDCTSMQSFYLTSDRLIVPFIENQYRPGLNSPSVATIAISLWLLLVNTIINLPGGQINDPSVGKHLSLMFLQATLASWSPRAFRADIEAFKLSSYATSGAAEIQ